jgi:hypothetical protein
VTLLLHRLACVWSDCARYHLLSVAMVSIPIPQPLPPLEGIHRSPVPGLHHSVVPSSLSRHSPSIASSLVVSADPFERLDHDNRVTPNHNHANWLLAAVCVFLDRVVENNIQKDIVAAERADNLS